MANGWLFSKHSFGLGCRPVVVLYFVRQIYILDPPYFTHYLVVLNNNKILLSINLETSRSAPEDESPSAVSMLFERIWSGSRYP